MFIDEISIETITGFLEAILEINNKTNTVSGAVFRGQSDSRWSISSGLSRFAFGHPNRLQKLRSAKQAFDIFDAQRHGYSSLVSSNQWDVLALAQHFGLPTRLLDWTMSPTVALFFALDGVKYQRVKKSELTDLEREEFIRPVAMDGEYVGIPEADAAVYMIPSSHNGLQAEWLSARELPVDVFGGVPEASKLGFCFVNPDVTNNRIKHQSGLFTVGVEADSPFPCERAYKMTIKRASIAEMRTDLVTLNIGAKSVYGDLEGLCRELIFTKFGGFANRYKS